MAQGLLTPIVQGWLRKIKSAADWKRTEFGKMAEECMRFFTGPYSAWMYGKRHTPRDPDDDFNFDEGEDGIPAPSYRMSINKAFEVVSLFGPVLYQRNPDRRVKPRHQWSPPLALFGDPNDPNVQQMGLMYRQQIDQSRAADNARAELLEQYLNYTPNEVGLRTGSRQVVDEALIKGMGTWWVEEKQMPTGFKVVGSFYDTVDNLLVDPDARKWEDMLWITRRCEHAVWEVEKEYNLPPGSLKGNAESSSRIATTGGNIDEDYKRNTGDGSNDLLVYYKVYSKMGLGGRLKNVMDSKPGYSDDLDATFGDNCFIVVADGVDYPLNLPPQLFEQAAQQPGAADDQGNPQQGGDQLLQQAAQWPVPYWLDDDWPCEPLMFHRVPGKLWPMSHLQPAMGELKFINWAYSMLAAKVRVASRDFIVLLKSSANEVKEAIKHGPDLTVIELDTINQDIDKVVKFLQHPQFNGEVYKMIDRAMELFDRRTGLTDLVYGETGVQIRSAEEAQVKQQATSIRPEDMAEQVEDSAGNLARKEMQASRWVLTAEDVAPVLGPIAASYWQQLVETFDPRGIWQQYEATVESGSTKRPDRNKDRANLQQAVQTLFTPLMNYAMQSGDVGPVNALIVDWAKSIELDASKYLFQPPAPPPMPGPQQGQPAKPQGGPAK